MKNYKGKYIGEKKIAYVNPIEEKTYLGADKVEVVFENEDIMDCPVEMLESSVSDEPKDATNLTDARINPIISKLIAVMAEAELTKDEIDMIIGNKLPMTLNHNINEAINKAVGKKMHDITLYDIDKILKK